MSETELSVVCKSCGSEVSPYVTECPYCGARLRKRAPKLERRGEGLEAKPRRRRRLHLGRSRMAALDTNRPYVTLGVIVGSAVLLIVHRAAGESASTVAGLTVPFQSDPWRYLTAPFAYTDVGYLFVVALAIAIFVPGLERRLGRFSTALLLVAAGSLGMLAAYGIANGRGDITVIAGGNGMALGALAAWLALRRAEAHGAVDEDFDVVGVAVAAVVLLALPIFESTADVFAGVVGGAVGGLAGVAAAALRPAD
jgi:membrane associated rhomboid family serine protease